MKLSWLNTSEAHTNIHNQAYKYEWAIWINARHNIRERARESGSIANTKICFEIRAPSSTSPPSYRRISTNLSTQDFPHREPPLRILGKYKPGVHNSSLNKYNLSLEARHKANTISTSQMRDRHKAKQPQSPLHLKGYKHHFHNHLYTRGILTQSPFTRGISQRMEGLELGDLKDYKQILSHKTRS